MDRRPPSREALRRALPTPAGPSSVGGRVRPRRRRRVPPRRPADWILAGACQQARPHAGNRVRLARDRHRGEPPVARVPRGRVAARRVRGAPPGGDARRRVAVDDAGGQHHRHPPRPPGRGDRPRQPLRLAARVSRSGRRRAWGGGVRGGGPRAGPAGQPALHAPGGAHRRRGTGPDGRPGAEDNAGVRRRSRVPQLRGRRHHGPRAALPDRARQRLAGGSLGVRRAVSIRVVALPGDRPPPAERHGLQRAEAAGATGAELRPDRQQLRLPHQARHAGTAGTGNPAAPRRQCRPHRRSARGR